MFNDLSTFQALFLPLAVLLVLMVAGKDEFLILENKIDEKIKRWKK
jgi:hypothetical protein